MNFQKLVLLVALALPLSASALVMRPDGPEPIIVQIKESLRTSDDLDIRLNELAAAGNQNHLNVVKWWAGRKLLVMLSFPAKSSERQATAVMAKLQQLPAVEKIVPVSGSNLHFQSADFVREYGPGAAIPDAARRGFDAERIGKPARTAPDPKALLQLPHVPNRLIVEWKQEHMWKADTTRFSQTMADFHRQTGGRVVQEFRYSPTKLQQVLEFDDKASLAEKLQSYLSSGYVTFAQPDYIYETNAFPNDPVYSSAPGPQWPLPKIQAPEAWNLTTGDPSVVIAVGDTGANVNHPEFSANLWAGQNNGEIHNFVSNSTNVNDDFYVYHGSNVAGIIGAQGNNGSYMTGVAWDTSLMILKINDSNGGTSSSLMASGISYAWQHGATAINISSGGKTSTHCDYNQYDGWTCTPNGGFDDVIVSALESARDHNLVVVSTAGNEGQLSWADGTPAANDDDNYNPQTPAGVPVDNMISVLATDPNDNRPLYSCYGKYSVDLGAPGGTSTSPVLGLKQTFNGNSYDSSNYSFLSGTSMAAPHVTGAISLIKSRFPWENYKGLRDRVLMGTDRTGTLEGLCRTNGRLNVYKALQTRSMMRNLSTRARVEGGDRVLIAGFVIGGSSSGPALKVGIRGLGPSVGVSVARLGNPRIELYNGAGSLIDANNNWYEDWNAADTTASGLQPSNNSEAAMVRWLNPGAYTVIVRDEGTQYGVGLFEIYELQGNTNEQSRLVNLSSRCLVGTGDEQAVVGTLVGDFNNTGLPKPDRRVLILGKGPSLAAFGLQGTLGDPQLSISNLGQYNNNWAAMDDDSGSLDQLEGELYEAGLAPGHYLESALWPTFAPASANTVVLSGVNGATGIGSIEIYEY